MSAAPVFSHPLLEAVTTARNALAGVADVQPVYLPHDQKQAALLEVAALRAQADELELRLLAASDDLAESVGARDAGQWLARKTRIDQRAGRAAMNLATAIDGKYVRVAAAMRTGSVNRAQAHVIVTALDALPDEVEPFVRKKAERHLVELAQHHDPSELRRLGQHLLEVVAPDIADAADAKALEREEQRALVRTSLRIQAQGDGTTRITIRVPDTVAARLETYLDAYTSPRVSTGSTTLGERMPRHRRLGEAFSSLLEHLDPEQLPGHGGDATTIIVTIEESKLHHDLATAGLLGSIDGDLRITATEARRLACTARILPMVLGGNGEILDLGRTRRLYSPAQRKALQLRDRTCRADGCTIPARWCEAHHLKPWSQGGKTDLADGVLFCSHHHHLAHDSRYNRELLPNGDHRFHRRP